MKQNKLSIAIMLVCLPQALSVYAQPVEKAVSKQQPAVVSASADQDKSASASKVVTLKHRSMVAAGKQDKAISNAYNFKSIFGSQVDPRTGMFSFHYTLGHMVGNNGFGPNLSLVAQYSESSDADPYGVAKGWSLNLSHYDNQSQMLSLSSGASFRITNINDTGLMNLQYYKLDNLHVYKGTSKDPYFLKVVYKDGHIEYLDKDGFLTEIESARGNKLFFHYDEQTGGHVLTEVVDETGHHWIKLRREAGELLIDSLDAQGHEVTSVIHVENGFATSINLPAFNENIQFGYDNYDGRSLMSHVTSPTGSSTTLHYTKLLGPDIPGVAPTVAYAVDKQITSPGSGELEQSLTYHFSGSDGHNYLGHGAHVPYQPHADLLFETPADYRYETTVDNGLMTTQYIYNKYHLLVATNIFEDGQLISTKQSQQCYPIGSGGQTVCGGEPVTSSIFNLPANYALMNGTKIILTAPASTAQNAAPKERILTTQSQYDDQGNILNKTDTMGAKIIYQYGAADQNGFVNQATVQTKTPYTVLGVPTPEPVRTVTSYTTLSPLDKTLKAQLYLPLVEQSQYQVKGGKWATYQTADKTYDRDIASQTYGLPLSNEVKLVTDPSGLQSSQQLNDVYQSYHYKLNDHVSLLNIDYQAAKSQQQYGSKQYNGLLKGAKAPILTQYKSAYTGETILQEDSQGNKTGFVYDGLGRKVAEIANVGSSVEATKHYQYIVGPHQNALIETAPNGYQSRVLYDGLGRVIEKDVQHIDPSSGKAVEGQWDQASSVTYDTYGNKVSETAYDTDGSGNPVALTTHYRYDNENRLTVTSYPDGAATVTAYDDVDNRVMTYVLASNGQAISNKSSPCRIGDKYYGCEIRNFSVVEKNNAGKVIANYLIASNPEGKSADGQPLYSGDIKANLVAQESYLAKGLAFESSWLTNWVAEVIQQKAYYSKSSKAYDGYNRVVVSTDIDGNQTHYHYDQKGDLIEKTLPGGQSQKMGYDMLGKLTQIGAMVGDQEKVLGTRYYNQLGELMWEKNPKGDTRSYQYDENGNPVQITTPNGDIIKQTYDEMNKLVKREVQGQPQYAATWTYDKATGQALTMQDATGTTHYSYYPDGKLKHVSHDGTGALAKHGVPSYTLSYTYTLAGKPKSITDAAGHVTQYHYDQLGRLGHVDYQR